MQNHRSIDPAEFDALVARKSNDREVSPDANGYILQSGGTDKGYITVDPVAKRMTFHWTSSTTAWPSEFDLVSPSGSPPSTSHDEVYEHAAFSGSASSHDISACQYRIEQNNAVVGYLRRTTTGLEWYAASGAPSGGYFAADTMHFKANTTSGSQTTHKIVDALT